MSLNLEQLIDVLAQSSGDERARSLVEEACASLGVRFPPMGPDLSRVIDALKVRPGAVGASIRLALRRADPARTTSRGHPVAPAELGSGAHDMRGGAQRLVDLLTPALGKGQAQHVVHSACLSLGLDVDWLTQDQVDRVLAHLSSRDDYIATAARFAKVKTLLGA